jgi:quercetin dioxygenase-like cupin family protein
MKNIKVNFWKVFFPMLIVLLLAINLLTNNTIAQTKNSYKVIEVKNQITEGKDKEVNMLFEGERRKIAQLTLRNEANLRWHSVAEPITIHCIVGEGELLIKNEEKTDTVKLLPGTFVTLESLVDHDVVGRPIVSILLIRYLDKSENEIDK